jgi:hypothetical protein
MLLMLLCLDYHYSKQCTAFSNLLLFSLAKRNYFSWLHGSAFIFDRTMWFYVLKMNTSTQVKNSLGERGIMCLPWSHQWLHAFQNTETGKKNLYELDFIVVDLNSLRYFALDLAY